MRKLLFLLLFPFCVSAQFTDDFSDGDFTSNPVWTGDAAKFIINTDTTLQSNGNSTAADTLYLTTPSTIMDSTEWQFFMKLAFNPTATGNYVKVYLVSDQAGLKNPLNGYFIRMGETGSSDTLELYEQTGSTETKILTGTSAFGSTTNARIKVTRDNTGIWSLYVDPVGGTDFNIEGTVFDNTHITTNFFGIYCKYSTTSRFDQYFFDDFYVGPIILDTTPPTISILTVLSDTTLDVQFSEVVEQISAETPGNYSVNNGIGNPSSAVRDGADSSIVHLTFSNAFSNCVTNILVVTTIEDLNSNQILADSTNFIYCMADTAVYRDVVINEIFADPSPQVGLPNAEFIELYNRSSEVFNLNGWEFSDGTTNSTLGTYILLPDDYVILCSMADASLYSPYGPVLGLSSWPTINNTGDNLTLKDNTSLLIDAVNYTDSWYNDNSKDGGGWTLELINPITVCSGSNNWTASNNISGGTPGAQNSVFDTIPDTLSPDLVNVTIVSTTQIELAFNESMDSTSLANGIYIIDSNLTVLSVQVNSNDLTIVLLTLSPAIDTAVFYTITATSVTDCSGNTISSNNSAQFVIGYQPVPGDIIINEILADPTPSVLLPEAEFIELYNLTNRLLNLSACLFDNNPFPANTFIQPNGFLIICDEADINDFQFYGDRAGLSSWPTLTNSGEELTLKLTNGTIIDVVTYSDEWYNDNTKDNGGWTLELINPYHPCSFSNNWTASNNSSGGTPGAKNSVFDTLPDTKAPDLTSAFVLNDTSIQLTFNEPMDSISLVTGTFTIIPPITVSNIQPVAPDFTYVILTLSPALDTGTVYAITVNNVTDCAGDTISTNNTAQFLIPYPFERYDILITEIFADPTPSVDLPEFEFFEIYNNSNKTFIVGNGLLMFPGEYIIWCKEEAVSEFEQYGKVISDNFSPLSNAGGTIWVYSGNLIIHSITYSDSWYGDGSKKDGGWSLEMIDPNNPCGEENNWRASVDPSGGTPGQQNSIYASNPDNQNPVLLRADAADFVTIWLTFDESLDYITAAVVSNYLINNGMVVDSVAIQNTTTVILTLSTVLQNGIIYTVTVNNVSDCVGNPLGANNTADFARPEQGDPGDLIINEALFNPRENGSDFVEIYNNSNKYINLQGWKIADDATPTVITIANPFVVFPGEYVVLTEDGANIKQEYPLSREETFIEMNLPGYNDGDGTVILKTNLTELSDRFDYDEDMHFPLLSDVDGVSLERIDFNRPTGDASNWHSAAENAGFATPGYENSQFNRAEITDNPITIDPEIFSPDNDGFNDVVNISYKFDTQGNVANVTIYDSKGRLVRYLIQNELLGTAEGTFSWDGINETREKARIGIYIILFEVFDLNGNVKKYKNTCVLASRL